MINDQLVRLYIVPNQRAPEGLQETTVFKTKTMFEIGNIQWFPLEEVNQRSCYNAKPFLRDIEAFVGGFKKEQFRKSKSRKEGEEEEVKQETVKESFMCDECDFNIGNTDDMKKHKQRKHGERWSFIKEDFIPKAWVNFSLDHDYLLELSLQLE